MKHKIASIMTVLIMSAAVLLVAGCDQLQGNKGENPSNAPSAADLKGVWKVSASGQYFTHIYFDGSTIFAASNVAGQFVKYPQTFTYNADGTISMKQPDGAAPAVLTPVKNGNDIELRLNGVVAYKMTKDTRVTPDTIQNAPDTPNPNPGPTPNPGNTASAADLKGVWKMTLKGTDEGQYTTHIYFDGSTIFAASNVAGQFVKYLQTFTYNADGTISMEQPDGAAPAVLTPVKNGEAIDLQTGGVTIAIMTKDASVTPDTIKNAPEIPNP